MFAAGELNIAGCKANAECKAVLDKVDAGCAAKPADKKAACETAYKTEGAADLPPFAASDFAAFGLSEPQYWNWRGFLTTNKWNGTELAAAAPAAAPVPAEPQPVAQPATQPAAQPAEPPADFSKSTVNKRFQLRALVGGTFGSIVTDSKLPGQSDQGIDPFGMQVGAYLAPFAFMHPSDRLSWGLDVHYQLTDLAPVETSDSLVKESMGLAHGIGVGLGLQYAFHPAVYTMVTAGYKYQMADNFYNGPNGVGTSSDGETIDQKNKLSMHNFYAGALLGFSVYRGDSATFDLMAGLTYSYGQQKDIPSFKGDLDVTSHQVSVFGGISVSFWGTGSNSASVSASTEQQPAPTPAP